MLKLWRQSQFLSASLLLQQKSPPMIHLFKPSAKFYDLNGILCYMALILLIVHNIITAAWKTFFSFKWELSSSSRCEDQYNILIAGDNLMPIKAKTMSIASISFHITYSAQLFWFVWAWSLGFCVTGACTADVDNTAGIWAVKINRNNVIRNIIKCSTLNMKGHSCSFTMFKFTYWGLQ